MRVLEIAWLVAASIGIGVHVGAWWEAWRDVRRSAAVKATDPRAVMAKWQCWQGAGRFVVAIVNCTMAVTTVLSDDDPTVTVMAALLIVTCGHGLTSVVELWTRAAVLDAVVVEAASTEHRRRASDLAQTRMPLPPALSVAPSRVTTTTETTTTSDP